MKRGYTTSFEEPKSDKDDALDEETQIMGGPGDETQAVDETQLGAVDETQAVAADLKHITLEQKAKFLQEWQEWQEQEAKFLQGLTPDVRARYFEDRKEIQAQQASPSGSKKPKLDDTRAPKSWSSKVLKPGLGVDGTQPLVPKPSGETGPLLPETQTKDINTKEQDWKQPQVRMLWPASGWREPTEEPPVATDGANEKIRLPLLNDTITIYGADMMAPKETKEAKPPQTKVEVQVVEGRLLKMTWYCLGFGLTF